MKIIDTNNINNEIIYEVEQNPKGVYVADNIICINLRDRGFVYEQ